MSQVKMSNVSQLASGAYSTASTIRQSTSSRDVIKLEGTVTSNGRNHPSKLVYNVPKEFVPQDFDVRSNSQAGIDPLSQVALFEPPSTLQKTPSDL